jgi:uncharacterized membrane protein HdeD (DUF308 family)
LRVATYAGRRGGGESLPWWLVLVEGILAAFLGLLLLVAPGATLLFLVQVLGLYLFIAGIFRIIGIFVDSSLWGLKLVAGLLCIIAGVLVLRHPLWSGVLVPTVVVFYIGFLSIFQGGIGIFIAFRGGGWGLGVLGALGILFGFILVINPLIGVAALPFVLGIFMLIGGVGAVVQAFRMRREVPEEQQPRRVR